MNKPRPKLCGVALIMVLIVIVLLSFGAYSFTELMTAQQHATMMSGRRAQAQAERPSTEAAQASRDRAAQEAG